MQRDVKLDQQKLLARHLTPADIHKALGQAKSRVARRATRRSRSTDWMVQTNAQPLQIEDFNDIPIKREGNAFIYMRDVADVRLAGPPQTNAVLVDGQQAVIIVVMKSSEASTLDVVDGIKKIDPAHSEKSCPRA